MTLHCVCGCCMRFCPVVFMAVFSKSFPQLLKSLPVGVGQIYGCDNPWTGGIFLGAILLSSPLMCLHAAIGSLLGIIAGECKTCSQIRSTALPRYCLRHLRHSRPFLKVCFQGTNGSSWMSFPPPGSFQNILPLVQSSDPSCLP